MISNKLTMAAQIPSRTRMPISGTDFCATAVREHYVAAGVLATGSFPGTSAWRPPTC